MTLTSFPARNEYTASAGQTIFNYTFKIYTDSDLQVFVTPSGQDANDSTDEVTGFSVSGVLDEDGGSITLVSATSVGDLVTIVSDIPSNRLTDYQSNGDFIPDTVNSDIDRAVSLIKQANDLLNRTVVSQKSLQGATPLSLPVPRAGSHMTWKSDLSGLENKTPATAPVNVPILQLSTYGTLSAAITSISSTDAELWIDQSDLAINSPVVVQSNITLRFVKGFILDGTSTLTINGRIISSNDIIFGTSLGVKVASVTWERPIEWFGALGDGSTNDYAAVLRGLKATTFIGGGGWLTFDPQKTYIINNGTSAGITLDADNLPDSTVTASTNEELPVFGLVGRGNPGRYSPSGNAPQGGLKFTGTGRGIEILSTTRKWRGQIYISDLNILGGTFTNMLASQGIFIEQMDTGNTIKRVNISYFNDEPFYISGFSTFDNIFEDIHCTYNGSYMRLNCNEQLFLRCKCTRNAVGGVYFEIVSAVQWIQGAINHNQTPQILIGSVEKLKIDSYLEGQIEANAPYTFTDGTGQGMVKFDGGNSFFVDIALRALHADVSGGTTQKEQYIISWGTADVRGLFLDLQMPAGFANQNGDTMAIVGPVGANTLLGAELSVEKSQATVDVFADESTESSFSRILVVRDNYQQSAALIRSFSLTMQLYNIADNTAAQGLSLGGSAEVVDRTWSSPWDCALVGMSIESNISAGSLTFTDANSGLSEVLSFASNGNDDRRRFNLADHALGEGMAFNPVVESALLGSATRDVQVTFYFSVLVHDQNNDS